jgi:hypothetical protein
MSKVLDIAARLANNERTCDIAHALGCTPSYVSIVKKRMSKRGPLMVMVPRDIVDALAPRCAVGEGVDKLIERLLTLITHDNLIDAVLDD